MKVRFEIRDDAVKGLDIRLTPIEGLTLHRALLQFAHELSNHEADRITAMQMCDAYIEAMDTLRDKKFGTQEKYPTSVPTAEKI
ncbi:MAG: hypothetical protein IJ061_06485 [Lachnospiraceae bacterium]|nr:hypothetical protein [Lachnospiraceae bacterium]